MALSGVVYKVKSTGPSTEPSTELHMKVWLYLKKCILFLRTGAYFANKKKIKFEPGQIFHTNQKVYLLM